MTAGRVLVATGLGFREQLRRPLVIVLLVGLPFLFITRAIVRTVESPRELIVPGGDVIATTMRDVHGANMAAITVAFLAALFGLFVIQSARQADRRLVVAGFTPAEAIAPRLTVLAAATVLVVGVSMAVTAINFDARAWGWFTVGNLLVGLIYGGIGALAGAVLGRLSATYVMLFAAMLDIGIAQNPMFGSGEPDAWATLLPGYGPGRIVVDAAFSPGFHAWGALAISLGWIAGLTVLVGIVLRRAIGTADPRGSYSA